MVWLTALGILFGIVSGTGGLVLSIYNLRSHERERKTGIEAVYLLINLEIRHNLERLWRLWGEVSVEAPGLSQSDKVADQRAYSLANAEVPRWTMLMWEAHAPRVNDALDALQISAVMTFYAQLERLGSLQSDVIKAHALAFGETVQPIGPVSVNTVQDAQTMQQIATAYKNAQEAASTRLEKYREFEALAVDVLQIGNPLADQNGFTKGPGT